MTKESPSSRAQGVPTAQACHLAARMRRRWRAASPIQMCSRGGRREHGRRLRPPTRGRGQRDGGRDAPRRALCTRTHQLAAAARLSRAPVPHLTTPHDPTGIPLSCLDRFSTPRSSLEALHRPAQPSTRFSQYIYIACCRLRPACHRQRGLRPTRAAAATPTGTATH
jgi:hypothetical protein